MANTTWSPTDKTANITLSGGNLTATASSLTNSLRAIDKQSSGKFYFEFTMNTSDTNTYVGLVAGYAALATASPANPSVSMFMGGTIWVNNLTTGISLGARTSGNILGLAVDLDNRLIWFRVAPSGNWNANASASPATGSGGISFSGGKAFAMFPWAYFNTAGAIVANFGDTAFSGAVPSGYTAGFTAGATPPVNDVTTLVSAEQWLNTNPALQATQLVLEQWLSVQTQNPQMIVTQAVLEMWMSVAEASTAQQARAMILA